MKRLLNKLIPPLIYDFLLTILSLILSIVCILKGSLFKKVCISKRNNKVVILGTGPSINKINFKKILKQNDFDFYSLSNFYLHKDIKKINPVAHFIAGLDNSISKSDFNKWMVNINKKLPKDTVIVTDIKNKKFLKNKFNNRNIFYINTIKRKSFFSINIKLMVPKPQSIPLLALPVAIDMKYKEIYMAGCDHDILKYFGKDIKNFYTNDKDLRKNLTSKSYWSNKNIINELESNINLFKQYEQYKKYSVRKKLNIYNLSKDSWLKYFPYKKI